MLFIMLVNPEKSRKDNSRKELETISEQYYMLVYKYCYMRMRSEDYCSDVTNEVFMVLCEKWDNLSKDNIQAWLYRTADNKLQEHFRHHRKKSKEIAYIEDLDDFRKNSLTYEQEFEAVSDDDIEIYREEILRELSEKERELFDLVYIDKKPYKKIIEELSITQETFNKRLYRLRKKIKTAVTMKIHE